MFGLFPIRNYMRLNIPAALTLAAVVTILIGLWATNEGANDGNHTASREQTELRQPAVPELTASETGMQMALQGFAAQNNLSEIGHGEAVLVPEDWEQPLFNILMNEEQSMDERNARLLELATGAARSVPAVQEECLMHLLFGIPDSNAPQFLAVATNPAIPVQMRVEFFKEALAMRPPELGEWLSQQLSNHYEPGISSVARIFLMDLKSEAQ